MYKKMKKEGVSPVIAVILMVAITVVLAGVLYVWVTSLANTEDQARTLQVSFKDGSSDKTSDLAYFVVGDKLLQCEQGGGDPINWNDMTVKCEVKDSGTRVDLVVLEVNGLAFSGTNQESQTGELITFGVKSDTDFQEGDYVIITITEGDSKVYTSTSVRLV